jgi:hypothetical protein
MRYRKEYQSPATNIVSMKVRTILKSVSSNVNLRYGGTSNEEENRSRTVGIIWDDTEGQYNEDTKE